jgi:CRISPR/Cas system-associated endoribonuclease Cas2
VFRNGEGPPKEHVQNSVYLCSQKQVSIYSMIPKINTLIEHGNTSNIEV